MRKELDEMIRYFLFQLENLNVSIESGTEATTEMILGRNPDAVVVATGAKPLRDSSLYLSSFSHHKIEGLDQENVVTIWEVLEERVPIGERVVVVDGEASWRTLCVAEYLADMGKKVEMITHYSSPALFLVYPVDRMFYSRSLAEKGIRNINNTEIKEISGDTITTFSVYRPGHEKKIEGVDTIVWAAGVQSDDRLYRDLKGKVKALHRVGDCIAPRPMEHAFWEGEDIGRAL